MTRRNAIIISILLLAAAAGVIAVREFRSKPLPKNTVDIRIPLEYTQPLVIATFNLDFRIRPLEARAAVHTEEAQNRFRYTDAYPNTDVVQTKFTNKLKEDIILKSPGHPEVFQYRIDDEGLEARFDEEGNLVFYQAQTNAERDADQRGNDLLRRFTIPAPYLIDLNGEKSSTKEVAMAFENGILTLIPNQQWLSTHSYPIILDPTIEINVLNVHSHPRKGDHWEVSFTTQGQADLKIIPEDRATIEDDEFVSLTCDSEERQPQILPGDVIYYPDWECDGIGKVIHYTLKAGKHTLRFEYGSQTAYAYNNPGISEASATANTTTTSTTYTLMDSMTLTPGAGDYLAVFSTTVAGTNPASNEDIFVSIFVNGVQQAHTERQTENDSSLDGSDLPIATAAHVNVGAGQAVEIRWHNDDGSTSTARKRTFNLFPVASADVSQATATLDATTSSPTDVLLTDMALTPGAGDYLALFSVSAEGPTAGMIPAFTLYVGGSEVAHTERTMTQEASQISNPFVYLIAAKVSPTAGQAVEVYWADQGPDVAGSIVAHERTLTLYKTAAANISEASATADTSDTNTTDALLNSMTLTPGAGDYLAIFSASDFYGTITGNKTDYTSLYVNSVQVAHTERSPMHEDSIDSSDQPIYTNGVVSPGAGQAVEVKWRGNDTTSRTVHERTFILLKEAVSNNTPTITSVTDTPDPTNPNRSVTFSTDWNDADSGELVKVKICSTDALGADQVCDGTTYATSTAFTTADPESVVYNVQGGDAGTTITYYAFVCDDAAACNASGTSGTVVVNAQSTVPNIKFR